MGGLCMRVDGLCGRVSDLCRRVGWGVAAWGARCCVAVWAVGGLSAL